MRLRWSEEGELYIRHSLMKREDPFTAVAKRLNILLTCDKYLVFNKGRDSERR